MELLKTIGDVWAHNLRRFRGKRTQAVIAEHANMSLGGYQRLESGRLPKSPATIRAVAKALGLESETELFADPDIFGWQKEPDPKEVMEYVRRALVDDDVFEAIIAALPKLPKADKPALPPSNVIEIEVDNDYSDAYIKTVETILSMLALLKDDDVAEVLEDLTIRFPWAVTDERTFTLRKRG